MVIFSVFVVRRSFESSLWMINEEAMARLLFGLHAAYAPEAVFLHAGSLPASAACSLRRQAFITYIHTSILPSLMMPYAAS